MPSAAAREGARGTKMKGGGRDQESNTWKIPVELPEHLRLGNVIQGRSKPKFNIILSFVL